MSLPLSGPPLSEVSLQSIAGKAFVITGGTQGLGLDIARNLKKLGAAGLILVSRNRELGAKLSSELSSSNCTCHYVYADLAKSKDAQNVIPESSSLLLKQGLTISGVVNAAATTKRGNLLTTSPEDFDFQMDLNVRAPFLVTQSAARHMIEGKQKGGSIVNICSVAAHGGAPFIMAYSVSKAALVTLTKNNATELAPHGIRVNGINMGWTLTDNEAKLQREQSGDDNWHEKADASSPIGRILRPIDVASTVCYLLSDCSAMMTGSVLDLHPEFAHGMLSLAATDSRSA